MDFAGTLKGENNRETALPIESLRQSFLSPQNQMKMVKSVIALFQEYGVICEVRKIQFKIPHQMREWIDKKMDAHSAAWENSDAGALENQGSVAMLNKQFINDHIGTNSESNPAKSIHRVHTFENGKIQSQIARLDEMSLDDIRNYDQWAETSTEINLKRRYPRAHQIRNVIVKDQEQTAEFEPRVFASY
jgi:hypothetical protein